MIPLILKVKEAYLSFLHIKTFPKHVLSMNVVTIFTPFLSLFIHVQLKQLNIYNFHKSTTWKNYT